MWFAKGEFDKARDEIEPDLQWMHFDLWKKQEQFQVSLEKLRCPQCQKPLAAIHYGDTDVIVDICSNCGGIWLDQGEFQKILDALEQELVEKSELEYIRAALEEAVEVVRGREGFASEWKDLSTILRLLQYRILSENPRLHEALVAIQTNNPIK